MNFDRISHLLSDLAFVFTPACLLQGALSRGCDGRLSGVLSRVAQGADCLSAVVLFSKSAGLS